MILWRKRRVVVAVTTSLTTLLLGASQIAAAPLGSRAATSEPRASILKLVGTIPLNGVRGRMDHLAFDAQRGRLFIAALENRSLEVVDVRARQRVKSLAGINEPLGVLFLTQYNRILVCSRGDGTLRGFDARTFEEGPWIDLGRNADNLRLDKATNTLYVSSNGGPGSGSLNTVDVLSLVPPSQGGRPYVTVSRNDLLLNVPRRVEAKAGLSLPCQPESFQLDPAHHRAFVNLPDEHVIGVIDTRAMKMIKRWPVPFKRNFSMAFSASRNRVFIATRNPPRLLVYGAEDGKLLAQVPCAGDTDEVFYDGKSGRLYVICGEGKVNVFDARSDEVRLLQTVDTAPRARTGAFLPSLQMLAVAAPRVPGHRAQILLYSIR